MGDNGSKSNYMDEWTTSLLAAILKVIAHALDVLRVEPPDHIHAVFENGNLSVRIDINFEVGDGL